MPTLIYETVYGSRAFGLARDGSDVDLRGVVVGPRSWYFGPHAGPEQLELGKDHVRYEIRKLVRLAESANPAVLELLHTDPSDHVMVSKAGERLIAARDSILTAKVGETFGQYGSSQLRRIETHRRWLLHPPAREPHRGDFGLPERTVIPRDQLGAAETLLESGRTEDLDVSSKFLDLLAREKRYRSARAEWEQHAKWLATRNAARAELESRFGYDTKHAMHLVRLLRMAVEILSTHRVVVKRPDRDELLAIRDGALCYDQLRSLTDDLTARVESARRTTTLPAQADANALERLCIAIVEEVLAC